MITLVWFISGFLRKVIRSAQDKGKRAFVSISQGAVNPLEK